MSVAADRRASLEPLARKLAKAWRQGTKLEAVEVRERPQSRPEAHFVQDLMAELIGEKVTGWKGGATSAKMRERDGHDEVVTGRTFASRTFFGSYHQLSARTFAGGRVEPEFAYRLLRRIEPRTEPWTVFEIAPQVAAHIAIEIVGSRYSPALIASGLSLMMPIADNGNGAGLIIGAEIEEPEIVDFQTHPVILTMGGGEPAANSPPDMRATPIEALVDIVNNLSVRAIALDEGACITTGSATDTLLVVPGSRAIADFGPLGKITLDFDAG